MVATGKNSSANSDAEPLYATKCVVSTCNKPILQDSSDKVCISCKQAARNATAKLKARRLKPKKSESGLWTPKSEASTMSSSGIDTIKRQIFSPLPPMAGSNDRGKKRKLSDSHIAAEEIKNWRNPKWQKAGDATENKCETDSGDQRLKAGTVEHQESLAPSDNVENAPQLPTRAESVVVLASKDARRTEIVTPISVITRSHSTRHSEAAESTGVNATELATSSPPDLPFVSVLPDIQLPHSKPSFSDGSITLTKPRDEAQKSAGSPPLPGAALPVPAGSLPVSDCHLSVPEGFPAPEESPTPLEDEILSISEDDSLFAPERTHHATDHVSTDGMNWDSRNTYEGRGDQDYPFLWEDESLSLSEDDSPFSPGRAQNATDNISTDSTNGSPENTYEGRSDQLTRSSSMPYKGSNVPSAPASTSPANSTLKQPEKVPVILSNDRIFTDNGIVQFQAFVPFRGASLDSIEPTLNPNSVQARRSRNPLGTEPDSLGFYDMLSKYRGSDEEFVARTLFDLRTEDESYISIQTKIAARGGRKRQFGQIYTRLEVDSTWGKHQTQPWKINPAGLDRDDLPLQKLFGEFNAKDMVPMVIEGELYLSQHEEYEGPRRTWRYGDGGSGKEQGYPEAQAGAWAHLAKAAIRAGDIEFGNSHEVGGGTRLAV
ncbi:hypothetical protein VE03_04636 [Pseudogymnoascus sp. 23342-1-I1]|nr:hypothetical protein VE03_04636 [Pseudogymnoascus sp. 23342-1-I1]